jgi:release factor glutamine methyltransferase
MNKPSKVTDLDWILLTEKYKDKKLEKVVKLIEKDYPIQYLIGNVDFYGYEIFVKKGVLIPRFETEGLLEETIKLLKDENMDDISVLDIGTGTGCIPVVLKKELPNLEITSIDVNGKAIKLAKLNASNYNATINFIKKNIFHYKPINKYSLIISNPPYVSKDEPVGPEIKYEPKNAIFADHEGLKYYEYIIKNAKKWTTDKNILAFEIGCGQGKYLKQYAKAYYPKSKVIIKKDLSQRDRYLFIINK